MEKAEIPSPDSKLGTTTTGLDPNQPTKSEVICRQEEEEQQQDDSNQNDTTQDCHKDEDALSKMEQGNDDDVVVVVLQNKDLPDNCEHGYLILPTGRQVPNCCAICLGNYEVSETVVWSINGFCKHAFHLECILDWLSTTTTGTPCPCCRQEFTDTILCRKPKKVTWDAGATLDTSVVRWW